MTCELLAPAGSMDAFRAALACGADAVYIGGSRFGARAYADNPDETDLLRAIDEAHLLDRKLYLTVNTLLKDQELASELYDWLMPYYLHGLDGVIVQDLGVIDFLQREFPELPLHASTQMTVTGAHGAEFLQQAGICRVVPARELSLPEIRAIYDRTGMEIECFVHGAMCYSYSGQCLMSSLSGGRSGNRGRCAGICRLPFQVYEKGRLLNGKNARYPLNMKDMCAIGLLPELLEAGVCSLKIEGRMKKPEYTAGVVRMYRKYLDICLENQALSGKTPAMPGADTWKEAYRVSPEDRQFLWDLFNRDGFSSGYYQMWNGRSMIALRNEKLTGNRQAAAQAVTEQMRRHLASPEAALALQREIDGTLVLQEGRPASLTLQPGDRQTGFPLITEGPAPVRAGNRPVTETEVRRQIGKSGGSPFRFRDLQIHMDNQLFVPMGQLNALRRNAFASLAEAVTGQYRRHLPETGGYPEIGGYPETGVYPETSGYPEKTADPTSDPTERERIPAGPAGREAGSAERPGKATYFDGMTLWAEVRTEEQLRSLLQSRSLHGFYLPMALAGMAEEVRDNGFAVRLALPYVLRKRQEDAVIRAAEAWLASPDLQDGVLVRNLEELGLFYGNPAWSRHVILDAGLYTMNREAERFFADRGFVRNTMPHELNAAEMKKRDNSHTELILYGRIPVMLSAQCLKKTLDRCTHSYSSLVLEDRKAMRFPVLCDCDMCMNMICNAVPLSLLGEKDRKTIQSLGIRAGRFLFTTETGEEAYRICKTLQCGTETTHGHFRRGVE